MADDNTCFFHAESTLACLAEGSEGVGVLFPSKKHVDATRAFASGFRGRKDGLEDPLGEARRPLPGRKGDGTAATAAARAGGWKEGEWEGTGRARKKGRGGGGRK